ncbi:MAG: hypothetical protein A3G81_26005 [Betaproteobacteria bacterium RIFCSPLOWO2_12_FULL_65_14]|nr:MAG: hypothetical protein A3G81_26005 [Betaproteobacteria bacterium RIFCSPLOWO2_12_FULL_65_14]
MDKQQLRKRIAELERQLGEVTAERDALRNEHDFYRTLTDAQLQAQIDALRAALAQVPPEQAPDYQASLDLALAEAQRRRT